MAQGVLGFQYLEAPHPTNLTSLAGLPLYLELAHVSGLIDAIRSHLHVRASGQGWTDSQIVLALVLLNLAGGESVSDLEVLEKDEGFSRILQRAELHDLKRAQRRDLERRWRKEKRRSVPSPSAVFRYLDAFHDPAEEACREAGTAFIPAPNGHLKALELVNRTFLEFVQKRQPSTTATLDIDATLIETHKSTALYSYKGFRSYQPINVWWAESGQVVFTEFRDGNVPAGHEMRRVLEAALANLPAGVERVRLRSDTAGYQHDVLIFCASGRAAHFGLIEFAIGCDVTPEFKAAVGRIDEVYWHDLEPAPGSPAPSAEGARRQWAEVPFAPRGKGWGFSRRKEPYRYIAVRELLKQQPIPGLEDQQTLPFPTMGFRGQTYKLRGIVTNFRTPRDEVDREMDRVKRKRPGREPECWSGDQVIHWLNERCGKSEEAHAVMKEDLAGGRLPSGDFGKNAAWWWIMILALNLNAAMKRLVLAENWLNSRLKAIRFHLIHIAGRIIRTANTLKIRISRGLDEIVRARERMRELAAGTI